MLKDIRFALRSLSRSPGFSAVIIATLALGIGVNTAIFSLVNGMLLRPLPFHDPERLVTLWETAPQLGIEQDEVGGGTFADWRERTESYEALAAYSYGSVVLTGVDEPRQIGRVQVSPSLFGVLGVQPVLGRSFRATEELEGDDRVVIVSNDLWTTRFGASRDLIGSAITLNDEPYVVVGVMPPGFEFPPDDNAVDLWTPLTISPAMLQFRSMRFYGVVGRLAEGVSIEQARAELEAVAAGIAEENPESNRGWSATVRSALDQVVGDRSTLLAVLSGAAGFVLLIGCVNIANLLMARSSSQAKEFALRATLGASRTSLIRRSFAESFVLAVIGGGAGLVLAFWGVDLLRSVLPADLPRIREVRIDGTVFAFTAVVSLGAGVLFGLLPAIRSMRPRLSEVLQEGGAGTLGGRQARRLLNSMVAAEVALALMLVVGAGVMVRSFTALLAVDPGFRTEGVLSVALALPESKYGDRDSQRLFYNELVDRLAAIPGVQAAGAVTALPMSPAGTDFDAPIELESGEARLMAEQPRVKYRTVIPGYFEAMGIPLVRGRLIDRFDREEGNPVMVINEAMERLLFPGKDPIGQAMGVPMAGRIEVIGVVGDVRHYGLDEEAGPEMFVSYQNFPLRDMHLVIWSDLDPAKLVAAARAEIKLMDPALPISRVATIEELLSTSLAQPRFNMALLIGFAVCALVLAAVGIYGVISYSVVQRSGEIGMRMALGADAGDTFRLVVGQALGYVVAGGVLGLAGALAVSRLISGLLFGVSLLDPVTLIAGFFILMMVAAAAASIPARRATRVDPVSALRGN